MTVAELIAKLTDMGRPDHIVDFRCPPAASLDPVFTDVLVDDMFAIDLPSGGWVTLLGDDPS